MFFTVILEIYLNIIVSRRHFNVDDTTVQNFESLFHHVSVITTKNCLSNNLNLFFAIFRYQSHSVVTSRSDILYFFTRKYTLKNSEKIFKITSHFMENTQKIATYFYYCAPRFDSLKFGYFDRGELVNCSAV